MPVDIVVRRLRERSTELRAALDGELLTLAIHVADNTPKEYLIVFSPDGHLSLLATKSGRASGSMAQVRFQGTVEQVLRVVLGETDALTAVMADNLFLSVLPADLTPRYGRVMRLVREEVWALLEAHPARE